LARAGYGDESSTNPLLGENATVRANVEGFVAALQALGEGEILAEATLRDFDAKVVATAFLAADCLTLADLLLFVPVHSALSALTIKKRNSLVNLNRWFEFIQTEHIQHVAPLAALPSNIPNSGIYAFDFSAPENKAGKKADRKEDNQGKKGEAKSGGNKKAKKEKKAKPPAKAAEPMVYRVDLRVGKINSCAAHPTDSKLLVSQVDVGEGKDRQIVSGLAPWYTPEQFTGKSMVVMMNLAEADIKGVKSNGRALAATSADGKVKEIVEPPAAAAAGERITFEGVTSAPDKALGKNHMNKIFKQLNTSDTQVAQFAALAFTTTAGPCTVASISGGTVC
jgi:methionine--tRNA ligase beta chain